MKTLSQLLAAALLVRTNGYVVSNDIMAEAVNKEAEEKKERVIAHVRQYISLSTQTLKSNVDLLRAYRRQEKEQKEKVAKMDRAVRYFLETGNPLPYFFVTSSHRQAIYFCNEVGMEMPAWDEKTADYQVPADWKPTETADVPAAE